MLVPDPDVVVPFGCCADGEPPDASSPVGAGVACPFAGFSFSLVRGGFVTPAPVPVAPTCSADRDAVDLLT
jgi:hypothetical protein